MGSYYAIIYRQFTYIPMAAIGSGSSFGFFMGIGAIMRTEMEGNASDSEEGKEKVRREIIRQIDPFTGLEAQRLCYARFIV